MPNLDQLLQWISYAAWVFFIAFAVTLFIRTLVREDLQAAILQMLSARVLVPLLMTLMLSFISAALVFVPPTNVAVIVSMISPGGVRPQPMRAGLHLVVPVLEKETFYPIYWQTYTMSNKVDEGAKTGDDSIRARTSDGQEVRLDNSIIFRIDGEQAVTVHVDWQERYIEDFVRPVVRGYVRTQVSQFTAQEVNSSARRDLESTLDRLLREELARKGIILDQFMLRDVTFTDEYAVAVEEKQVAAEGMARAEHEAQQVRNRAEGERDRLKTEAEGERDRLILEAEGRAKGILLEAEAQAQALTLIADALAQNRDLLTYEYINKLSPNIRAMLVPNNAPLILPLDELVQDMDMRASITETVASPVTVPAVTSTPQPQLSGGALTPAAAEETPTPTPAATFRGGANP